MKDLSKSPIIGRLINSLSCGEAVTLADIDSIFTAREWESLFDRNQKLSSNKYVFTCELFRGTSEKPTESFVISVDGGNLYHAKTRVEDYLEKEWTNAWTQDKIRRNQNNSSSGSISGTWSIEIKNIELLAVGDKE